MPYSKEEIGEVVGVLPNNFEITRAVFREVDRNKLKNCKKKYKISSKDFLITIVLGGGGELKVGKCESPEKIIDIFFGIFKKLEDKITNLKVVISTGPYYYKKNIDKHSLEEHPVEVVDFEENMLELMSVSDLVISSAGYNACQEIIQAKTPAILVPLWRKNKEQFERSEYLKTKGVVDVLEDNSFSSLLGLIEKSYKNLKKMKKNFSDFSDLKSGNKKIAQKILKILN